jgi:acyl dehydratase
MNIVLNPPPASLQLECGPVTALDLALYAASSSDHNPLHLDDEIASAAGFERPVVHGMLTMAFAARLLTTHFGAQTLRSLETRFVSVAQRGERIVLTGTLERAEECIAHYALSAHNDAGELLISGSAQISLRMFKEGDAG